MYNFLVGLAQDYSRQSGCPFFLTEFLAFCQFQQINGWVRGKFVLRSINEYDYDFEEESVSLHYEQSN